MARPVVIAGGGLSGLTTAINLARGGREVHVHEAREEIGARFHGDIEALDTWLFDESLPDFFKRANLKCDFELASVDRFTIFDCRRDGRELKFDGPIMHLVRRGAMPDTLDQSLKRQAIEAGVHLHLGSRIEPKSADVVATGPGRAYGIVAGYLFKTNAPDSLTLLFDERAAPGGYGCLTIAKGMGEASVVLTKEMTDAQERRPRILEAFRKLRSFDVIEPREYSGHGALLRSPRRDKIRVGEAGGFQDELWGFGMRLAMESGLLAAQAILEERDYWRMVKERLTPVVHRCSLNRRAVDAVGDRAYTMLASRLMSSNDPRGLIRLFHRPGRVNVLRSMISLGLRTQRERDDE